MEEPASTNDTREGLSVQETCEIGGFGKSTLYQLIGQGLLPAKKLGRKTIILRSDLLNFLRSLPNLSFNREINR
jgi:excisionase family DNA binding protein